MQCNEDELKKRARQKAVFYFEEKINAHVNIIPTGFKNGSFKSELIKETYYWFYDFKEKKDIRLFLSEIYDIKDYEEEEKC